MRAADGNGGTISPDRAIGKADNLMLGSLEIRNFRCFKRLDHGSLKRFNFVVGDGGSGKTALLESMFLAGGGSPEIYLRIRSWRGFDQYRLQNTRESFESLFRDLFYDLDASNGALIRLSDSNIGDRTLRIHYGKDEPYALPIRGKPSSDTASMSALPLYFNWKSQAKTVETKVYIEDQVLKISGVQDVYPIHFITPLTVSPSFSAQMFSQLSRDNRHHPVVEALQELFPMIREITTEYTGGEAMLYASLDRNTKKFPVAVLSGGMNKYLSIVLSIIVNPGGALLVDEIENGFYYKFLTPMLRSIVRLCEQHNVQMIASTHSYELLQALLPVIEEEREETFSLLRTVRDGNESKLEYIKGSSYRAAIEQGFEVR
jgi:AAA15 family ATPase/GTPase